MSKILQPISTVPHVAQKNVPVANSDTDSDTNNGIAPAIATGTALPTTATATTAPHQSSKVLSNTSVFLLLTGLLLLCYLPVVIGTYGCADDFLWVAGALQHNMQRMQVLQIVQGRPAMAVLFTLGFSAMSGVGDLRFLRLFSIITVACLAFGIYRTLIAAKHNRPAAFFVALAMCMMPPFQVYVSWASTAFYATGALVAGIALHLADRGYAQTRAVPKYKLATGSILLLLAALLIFQPSAMFYWVFAAILLLKPNATFSGSWRRFVWYGALCVVALGLAFGICHLGTALFGSLCPLPHRRTHLCTDLWAKCVWFFTQPLTACLNFESLFPKPRPAMAVAAVIAAGLMLYTKGKIGNRVLLFLLALSIIPLSYLPNLVIEESWASYRTMCALGSLIVLYAFLALLGLRQTLFRSVREPFFTALMGSMAIAAMSLAFNNIWIYFVVPNSLEYAMLKGQLNKETHSKLTFHQVALKDPKLLVPGMSQEFGCPSSILPFTQEPMEYILRHTAP